MNKLSEALKDYPYFLGDVNEIEPTIAGLVNQAQFEIDLYEENDDSKIRTPYQLKKAKQFLDKWYFHTKEG